MHIPKPGLLHFLVLSVSLNVVLIGLVTHFLTEEKPSAAAIVETTRRSETAGLPASRVASSPASPISAPASTPSRVAPTTAANQAPPTQEFAPPVAQPSWTPPVTSAGGNGSTKAANPVSYDPATPGNSFNFNGTRVAVEGESLAEDGSSEGMVISLSGGGSSQANTARVATPSGTGTTSTGNSSAANTTQDSQTATDPVAQSGNQASTGATGRARKGAFTYEEELFRTKWGWQAFNDAQSAAAATSPRNSLVNSAPPYVEAAHPSTARKDFH